MENELDFQVLIASNEQVVDAYPGFFKELNMDIIPIHIEKDYERVDHSKDPRIILLPSGIISVMSIMSEETQDFIWGDYQTEEYKNFLIELNKKISEWRMGNTKESMLSHQETINGKEYAVDFFPYQNIDASKVLMDSIEKKLNVIESSKKPVG